MTTRAAAIAVLLSAQVAQADGRFPSTVAARTVAPRQNVFEFAIGIPDALSVGWRHGVASGFELGLRGSFTLGLEGPVFVGPVVTTSLWARGAKLQGLLKVKFFESRKVSLGLSFEPGFFFATWGAYPGVVFAAGILLPVELKLGVALSDRTTLGFTLGTPIWVEFQALHQVMVPVMAGVGIEHAVNHAVLLFARVRAGPSLRWGGGVGLGVVDAQLGLAWRP